MRYYILASHGYLAKALLETAEIIAGPQERIYTLNGYVDGNNNIKQMMDNILEKIPKNSDIILFTDILGGSINNELISYTERIDGLHLITGMNLPLLLSIIMDEKKPIEALIRETLQTPENLILYYNDLENVKEEDF